MNQPTLNQNWPHANILKTVTTHVAGSCPGLQCCDLILFGTKLALSLDNQRTGTDLMQNQSPQ